MDIASTVNLIVYIIVGLMFFLIGGSGIAWWKYGRDIKGDKMIAEIELPNGHIKRVLTPVINGGRAVKVDEFTYMLAQDVEEEKSPLSDEEKKRQRVGNRGNPKHKPYPIRKWGKYPDVPFMGFKFLQRTVRLETWYINNPEPQRPFYGSIDEKGYFTGTLHATASGITSMMNEGQAAQLVGDIEEMRAKQTTLEKTLRNIPSKNVLYIGIGAGVFFGIVSVILGYVIYTGIDVIISGGGF